MGVLRAFGAKVAGTGFGLLFNILLARLLGPAGIGIYFLVLAIIGFGATFARLGLDMAALRYASVAYNNGNMSEFAALYRRCLWLVMIVGTAVTVVIWNAAPYLELGGSSVAVFQMVLPVVSLAVIPVALLRIQGQFFKSSGAPGAGNFVQAGAMPALLLLITGLAMLAVRPDIETVAYIYVAAAFLAVIVTMLVQAFRVPGLLKMPGHFETRLLLRTSMPLLWVASMTMVMSWTDILVLGYWTESDDVGVYGIATRVAALLTFILVSVNSVTAPKFATLHAGNDYEKLERLAHRSTAWMISAALLVAVPMLVLPELILGLFGENFTDGALILRILLIAQIVNVAVGSVGQLLMMTGNEKVVRNNTVFAITVNLVGNLTLIPIYGVVGAAVSTAVAIIVQNVVLYWKVRQILGISTMGFWR